MTKNEAMALAKECGLNTCGQLVYIGTEMLDADEFSTIANAILERAAVECEEFGHNEDRPYDYGYRIRALKITTGEGHE